MCLLPRLLILQLKWTAVQKWNRIQYLLDIKYCFGIKMIDLHWLVTREEINEHSRLSNRVPISLATAPKSVRQKQKIKCLFLHTHWILLLMWISVFLPPEPVAWSSGTWRLHTGVAGILAWFSSHPRVLASLKIKRGSCLCTSFLSAKAYWLSRNQVHSCHSWSWESRFTWRVA